MADPLATAEANANASMAAAEASGSPEADQAAIDALAAQEKAIKDREAKLAQNMQTSQTVRDTLAKQAKKALSPAGPKIVNLDEENAAKVSGSPENVQKYFFGEIGLLTFPDKSTYHIRSHHATVTDPALIDKINALSAKNPSLKIFKE